MSDNQEKIDPVLLEDANPAGLNPGDAVNGGLSIQGQPRGIKRINKKGIILVGGLIGIAAIVATTTFNQAGKGMSDSAKDAIANQGKGNKPGDLKRDALWYANVPDKVAAADQQSPAPTFDAGAPQGQGAPGQTVPDLTGKAVSPFGAATAQKTTAPTLGGGAAGAAPAGGNGRGGAPDPQAQAEAQARQAAAQRDQQALQQAMSSGLAASGFGNDKATLQFAAATSPAATPTPGYNGAAGQLPPQQKAEDDQNKQERKDQFLKNAKVSDPDYSPNVKTAPRSPYEVKAGSVIPAVMISGISSDLPGEVIAQVRENVYDTKTGRYLLIPQGSRLVGLYDAHVAYGQKRVLLAWSRIIYPDGNSFNLKGMPGADQGGYAGFFDQVDNHYFKIFGSAFLMSMISAGVQLSQPNSGSSGTYNQPPSVSQTVGAALGQQLGQTGMTMTQKNLNIQPTLEIRPGYQFNVMVTADLILPPAGR